MPTLVLQDVQTRLERGGRRDRRRAKREERENVLV